MPVSDRICSFPGCTEPHHGKGYCYVHYIQYKRTGRVFEITPLKEKHKCSVDGCTYNAVEHGLCDRHRGRKRAKDTRRRRHNTGLCADCGKVSTDHGERCPNCVAKYKIYMEKCVSARRTAGLCCVCGKQGLTVVGVRKNKLKIVLCKEHYIRRRLRTRIKTHITKDMVSAVDKKLEEQQNKCYYTGEPLTLGVNTSLDHYVPSSRGGAETVDNLVWTLWSINKLKTNLLHDEFIAMCKDIVATAARRNADAK